MYAISFAHKSIRPFQKGVTDAGMRNSFAVSDELGRKIIAKLLPIEDAIAVYMTGKSPEILLKNPKILTQAPVKAAADYVPPTSGEGSASGEAGDRITLEPKDIVRLTKVEAATLAQKLGVGGEGTAHKDNVAALLGLAKAVAVPAGEPAGKGADEGAGGDAGDAASKA